MAGEASVCPLCGGSNDCAVAGEPRAGAPVAGCWCHAGDVDARLVRWLAAEDLERACLCRRCASGDLPSPCIDVCQLDEDNTRCVGCLRTLEEIGAWGTLDAVGRARVLLRLREARESKV